ncbi:hypothetical protein LXL04_016498 [Taraxacum kok-saghyz]
MDESSVTYENWRRTIVGSGIRAWNWSLREREKDKRGRQRRQFRVTAGSCLEHRGTTVKFEKVKKRDAVVDRGF